MADKRMITRKVTDDDNFLSLSSSSQALYLHLSMAADDDGFCNQVSICMFRAHASIDDLKALLEKRYIYQFDNGVIVIKHWRMANALRKDRYTPTNFQEEFKKLGIKDNGSYTWLPNGCQMVAIDKDSIDKNSIDYINNIDIVEQSIDLSPSKTEIKDIIEYLNNKLGTKYKASKNTTSHISARIKEGFTVEDFKKVIDSKYEEWHSDEKMRQFLRPQTLFSTKFESYLNNAQLAPVKKKDAFDMWRDA